MPNPRNEKAYALRHEAYLLKKKVATLSADLHIFSGTSRYVERKAQIARVTQRIRDLDAEAKELDTAQGSK